MDGYSLAFWLVCVCVSVDLGDHIYFNTAPAAASLSLEMQLLLGGGPITP